MSELQHRKKSSSQNEPNENFHEEYFSKENKSLKLFNNQNRLLSFLILFRVINAICTRTYFNPDEYWQSVEVGHYMVFGYPK